MAATSWRPPLPWRPAGVTWRGQASGLAVLPRDPRYVLRDRPRATVLRYPAAHS